MDANYFNFYNAVKQYDISTPPPRNVCVAIKVECCCSGRLHPLFHRSESSVKSTAKISILLCTHQVFLATRNPVVEISQLNQRKLQPEIFGFCSCKFNEWTSFALLASGVDDLVCGTYNWSWKRGGKGKSSLPVPRTRLQSRTTSHPFCTVVLHQNHPDVTTQFDLNNESGTLQTWKSLCHQRNVTNFRMLCSYLTGVDPPFFKSCTQHGVRYPWRQPVRTATYGSRNDRQHSLLKFVLGWTSSLKNTKQQRWPFWNHISCKGECHSTLKWSLSAWQKKHFQPNLSFNTDVKTALLSFWTIWLELTVVSTPACDHAGSSVWNGIVIIWHTKWKHPIVVAHWSAYLETKQEIKILLLISTNLCCVCFAENTKIIFKQLIKKQNLDQCAPWWEWCHFDLCLDRSWDGW